MPADSIRIEPATIEDLSELTDLVMSLMAIEADFKPNAEKQRHGLQLILEQPSRGRIFVLRNDHRVIGMVNLLFTISTAEGGFVILMEDVIIRLEHRGQGYGSRLVNHVKEFAEKKDFKRITLLTDRVSEQSQRFFARNGFVLSHMVPMRLMLAHEVACVVPSRPGGKPAGWRRPAHTKECRGGVGILHPCPSQELTTDPPGWPASRKFRTTAAGCYPSW